MFEIRQTGAFGSWMRGLRDLLGRAVIARRVERISQRRDIARARELAGQLE